MLTPQWGVVRDTFPTVQNRFFGPGTSLVARLTQPISHTLAERSRPQLHQFEHYFD